MLYTCRIFSKKLWQLPLSFILLADTCSMVSAIPRKSGKTYGKEYFWPEDGYGKEYIYPEGSWYCEGYYEGYWKNGKREGEGTSVVLALLRA